MCPVCGVTLELATESPQAIQERDFIRKLIAQGLTKDEIKDRLVAEFGPEVLAEPGDSGFDLAAWLVPGGRSCSPRWRSSSGCGAGGGPGPSEEPAEATSPSPTRPTRSGSTPTWRATSSRLAEAAPAGRVGFVG